MFGETGEPVSGQALEAVAVAAEQSVSGDVACLCHGEEVLFFRWQETSGDFAGGREPADILPGKRPGGIEAGGFELAVNAKEFLHLTGENDFVGRLSFMLDAGLIPATEDGFAGTESFCLGAGCQKLKHLYRCFFEP